MTSLKPSKAQEQEVIAMNALDRIGEALKARGITLEQMIESGREIRGQLVEEKYGIKTKVEAIRKREDDMI